VSPYGTEIRVPAFSFSPHIPSESLRAKMGKKGRKKAQNPKGLSESGNLG